jgi:hypothetical protein
MLSPACELLKSSAIGILVEEGSRVPHRLSFCFCKTKKAYLMRGFVGQLKTASGYCVFFILQNRKVADDAAVTNELFRCVFYERNTVMC